MLWNVVNNENSHSEEKAIKISKEKFFKTDIRNHKNPKAAAIASFKAMGMSTKELESAPNNEIPYNPIELEYQ